MLSGCGSDNDSSSTRSTSPTVENMSETTSVQVTNEKYFSLTHDIFEAAETKDLSDLTIFGGKFTMGKEVKLEELVGDKPVRFGYGDDEATYASYADALAHSEDGIYPRYQLIPYDEDDSFSGLRKIETKDKSSSFKQNVNAGKWYAEESYPDISTIFDLGQDDYDEESGLRAIVDKFGKPTHISVFGDEKTVDEYKNGISFDPDDESGNLRVYVVTAVWQTENNLIEYVITETLSLLNGDGITVERYITDDITLSFCPKNMISFAEEKFGTLIY